MAKSFVVFEVDDQEVRTPGSRHRVADGTAEQVIVMLLRELDTQQLHNLQVRELPWARGLAVMTPERVLPTITPAPGCEHGWNETFDVYEGD